MTALKTTGTRLASGLVVGLLAASVVACSSSDDVTEPAIAPATSAGQAQPSGSESPTVHSGPDAAPAVKLGGAPVAADFAPVRCKWEEDDGFRQLEYDAGTDGTDVNVEIVMSDPPRLDDFSLEVDGVEWEASSEDRSSAGVEVSGDRYHVVSTVAVDDDAARTNELDVTFTCPPA